MDEFITFSFDDVKLLMKLDDRDAFYPLQNQQEVGVELPEYIDGMFDLLDTPNLILNIHRLLDLTTTNDDTTQIFFKVHDLNLDFVVKINFPSIMELDMSSLTKDWLKISNPHSEFPFLNYVDINDEIYLYIDRDELGKFVGNDISNVLEKKWTEIDFSWIENVENIYRLQSVRSIPQGSPTIIKSSFQRKNIFIVKIGGFYFALEESLITEIKVNQELNTPIAGASYWVNGVMDYRGDSIPNIDLLNLFNIETNEESKPQLSLIINDTDKFAINVESIQFIDSSKIEDFGKKIENKNLPFKFVFTYQDEFVFMLNIGPIYQSVYNDTIDMNWGSWTQWFKTFKYNKAKLTESKTVLKQYLGLEYGNVDLLLYLEDQYTFYHTNHSVTEVDNLPKYCLGLIELAGIVCIYVDLQKMLNLPEHHETEQVILHISSKDGEFAFLIPKPKSVGQDPIPGIKVTKSSQIYNTPISSFYIVENETYAYIQPEMLTGFIADEMGTYLDSQWNERKVIFEELLKNPTLTPFKSKISYTITTRQSEGKVFAGSKVNAFYTFNIKEAYFILNANNIVEFDIIDTRITKMPHASNWMVGVLDFKGNHLPVVDLSQWLGLPDVKNRFFVVIKHDIEQIALLLPTMPIYTDGTEFVETAKIDPEKENLPIDKIFTSQDQILYHINYASLSTSIVENKLLTIAGKSWTSFLKFKYERPEQAAMIDLRDYLLVTDLTETKIGFEMTDVIEITAFIKDNHHFERNQIFSKFKNEWIPTIFLDSLFDGSKKQEKPLYSIVFETQGNRYEIVMENIDLIEKGEEEEKAKDWNFRTVSIVWNEATVYKHRDTFVLKLEASKLYDEITSSLNTELLGKLQQSIIKDEIEEETQDYYTDFISLCDPNFKVYLLMPRELTNGEEGSTSIAFPIDEVEEVRIDLPEKSELVPWEYAKNDQEFIYLKIQNGNGGVFHQIPSSCKLMAFDQSKIIQENGSIFIDSKQEKIPVQKNLVKEVKK